MLLSKCAVCGSKTYIKKQEASQILSSLDLKTPLSKIPLFGDVLFSIQFHGMILLITKGNFNVKWMK